MQSLREKLIKAGLIKEEQRAEKPVAPPEPPQRTPSALDSKASQRRESLRQLETDRTVRQWVQTSQVAVDSGERVFFFMTRKNKLRRWEISEAQAQMLEAGGLAIVERPEPGAIEHSLVPAETAEKILAISPKSVRFFNRAGSPIGFSS
ncbi:MAG TPA: DUF2058 family protein [Myxococcaceae bacterium]|nr:DUF2058 family protein [Myxococcaceae bacterium]